MTIEEEIHVEDDKTSTLLLLTKIINDKLLYLRQIITIEPIMCLYLLATSLREPIINNLLLEMACKANAGFNNTVCSAIVTAVHEQKNLTSQNSAVQQHINQMLGWCLPVQSTIIVILLLFMGTYSDKNKVRKPFLLVPIFGDFFSTACCIICVSFRKKWPIEIAGISQYVIPSVFGSSPMLNMACYAYIADVSTSQMCIIRMAALQICTNICKPIGITLGGLLFDKIEYIPSLLLNLFILTAALFYGISMVKESKTLNKSTATLFSPQHAIETLKLVTKAKGVDRSNIIFVLVIYFIIIAVFAGEGNVLFWFTQQTYGWRNTDFAFYQATRSVINSIALATTVPVFSKVLHLHDLTIVIISFINKVMSNIICMAVRTSIGLYAGTAVGMLTIVAITGIRSQSTKYVSENDNGKTQSLLSIVEAIAITAATQVYNLGLYSYTREIYGQAFFGVGILLYILGLIIITWKYMSEKNQLKDNTTINVGQSTSLNI